ncbi:MAG: heavy metal translocating P-type ATPase [Acutalibacteraceae bacterium]
MTRKQRKNLYRIIAAAVLLVAATLADVFLLPSGGKWEILKLAIYLVPYFVIGYDILWRSAVNISHGQVFDENFLMVVATLGALCIGFFPDTEEQYREAVFVMLFYQVGELFQSVAVGKSRKSISSLMDIRPDCAYIERDGELVPVDPETVAVGDIITVRPGEKIPLDGIVTEGTSDLNTVALTGEADPRAVAADDAVISGCVNMSGVIKVKVTHTFGESTVSKILELVENSSENKSKSEQFITKFARIYTPAVVIAAVLLAVLPPLVIPGSFIANFPTWLIRALTFLVISCPCALVISVPLSFFGGIGGASKKGILVKGSNYLETLSKVKTAVFDKTGTLTKGTFSVTEIHPENITEEQLLHLAAHAEAFSNHPIAVSLRNAYGKPVNMDAVADVSEITGRGVKAKVDGKTVYAGNAALMQETGLTPAACPAPGTVIHVSYDGKYAGYLLISDTPKETSKAAIAALKECGVERIVMLTGDRKETAEAISKELSIDEYHAGLLPADKVDMVEKLLSENRTDGKLAFVGDGINDAPVLMRADVGIAMGALGSDAAIEAADIVLMDDDPAKIAEAMKISRLTLRIVRQNIVFALAVKAAVLLLGALGLAPMWLAVFADVGVAFLAILNAMRTLKK